ncbi:MAG: hypothetical protein AABW79_02415 [Nanoarchaeota archaeon]
MNVQDKIRIYSLKGHSDNRRDISDVIEAEPGERISIVGAIIIKENMFPLANHYHTRKDEKFAMVLGKTKVIVGEPREGGDRYEFELDDKHGLYVPRGLAHAFIAEPGSILIHCAINVDPGFDPQATEDNIRYNLL